MSEVNLMSWNLPHLIFALGSLAQPTIAVLHQGAVLQA